MLIGRSGWVANTSLTPLTGEKAQSSITDKMRKDLKAAFELAAEQNPIEHYKEVLQKFESKPFSRWAPTAGTRLPRCSPRLVGMARGLCTGGTR